MDQEMLLSMFFSVAELPPDEPMECRKWPVVAVVMFLPFGTILVPSRRLP